jgi:hypothetical protein
VTVALLIAPFGALASEGAKEFAHLQDFVHDHRLHGALTADVTPPAWNGYLLKVVAFERWVASVDADIEPISWAQLEASRN